jgi:predicted dehydrogenase
MTKNDKTPTTAGPPQSAVSTSRKILNQISSTLSFDPAPSGAIDSDVQLSHALDDAAFLKAPEKQHFSKPPQILVIGAGSRGTSYARSALGCSNAVVAAVCEPIEYKRNEFGRKFIWGDVGVPRFGACFSDWREWVCYEKDRRESVRTGKGLTGIGGFAPIIIDAVFICVLDEMHEEVICGIADLGVHICVEKPLSTRLESCMNIYRALKSAGVENGDANGTSDDAIKRKETVFGICHVLRYSPHNMMLRHLVLDKEVIGDVLSIEHVEPVGWWHFSHSYVR